MRCNSAIATISTGPNPEGYGLRQGAIRGGRRESGVTAFLKPASHRPNLTVITNAVVARVAIENGRATGVDVLEGTGTRRRIAAQREVILCGGTVGSPQMLLLSGIGDGAALQTLGHRGAAPPARGRRELSRPHRRERADVDDEFPILRDFLEGAAARRLERSAISARRVAARLPATSSSRMPSCARRPGWTAPISRWCSSRRGATRIPFPCPLGHGFVLSIVLLHPKSRGRLTLASPDPRAKPLIDPRLMSAPEDFEPMLRGLKLARRIFATPAFAPYQATEFLPGAKTQSDDDWKEYVRATAATVHHLAGTCRMGTGDDAVVTPELKVRGIEGLRVADASIFPKLMGGNTNAPVVMVAEKAADMILGRAPPAPLHLPQEH